MLSLLRRLNTWFTQGLREVGGVHDMSMSPDDIYYYNALEALNSNK